MTRIDPYTYAVTKGEKVTVEVASQGFAPPMAVASGGQTPLQASTPDAATLAWQFKVTRNPGQDHRVRLGFVFQPTASASEHYHIHVSGNETNGYDAPDFYETDGENMGLRFRVRAS